MQSVAVQPNRLDPHSLKWSEAIRCREVEDTTDAHSIALAVLREGSRSLVYLQREITARLVDRFGRWAMVWSWSLTGHLGGGPLDVWCSTDLSLTTPEETAPKVRVALDEWRAWLLGLYTRFQELAVAHAALTDPERAFQQAATLLVHDVVVQTNANDAWYTYCEQVLEWYLEYQGIDPAHAVAMVDGAISGKFFSWTGPDDTTVAEVTDSLAQKMAEHHGNHG